MANKWNFLGNQWAVDLLHGQIANQSLRHAYLISGPDAIGRRTLALRLAQAVNCENPPAAGDYCGTCRPCRSIAKMQYPDLHIVEIQEGDRKIKIEAIRELSRMLALTPYEAKMQIALLLDFDQASEKAANALLKTLEEPSERVLLLLTAESVESLPATIASRCEVLALRPMKLEKLAITLTEQQGLDAEKANLVAQLSGGRPGLALQLAQDEEALQQRSEWLRDVKVLAQANRVRRFAYAKTLGQDREMLRDVLDIWLGYWRNLLMAKNDPSTKHDYGELEAESESSLNRISAEQLFQFVSRLQDTIEALKGNVNAKLAMESLLLSMPKRPPSL